MIEVRDSDGVLRGLFSDHEIDKARRHRDALPGASMYPPDPLEVWEAWRKERLRRGPARVRARDVAACVAAWWRLSGGNECFVWPAKNDTEHFWVELHEN